MDVPMKKAAAALTARTPPRTTGKKADTKPTTLLDVHEVEWITRELERLLAKEQSAGGDGDAGTDAARHRRKRAKLIPEPKKGGGFFAELLGRHAVSICSGDDAVDDNSATSAADRGRRPRGHASGFRFREVDKA